MDFLWNRLTEWLKEMLVGGIMDNLTGLFDSVNEQVSVIAGTVPVINQIMPIPLSVIMHLIKFKNWHKFDCINS